MIVNNCLKELKDYQNKKKDVNVFYSYEANCWFRGVVMDVSDDCIHFFGKIWVEKGERITIKCKVNSNEEWMQIYGEVAQVEKDTSRADNNISFSVHYIDFINNLEHIKKLKKMCFVSSQNIYML